MEKPIVRPEFEENSDDLLAYLDSYHGRVPLPPSHTRAVLRQALSYAQSPAECAELHERYQEAHKKDGNTIRAFGHQLLALAYDRLAQF